MTPLRSAPTSRFAGAVRVPGDKSISHRALLLAASAVGESRITGLLEGQDVMRTAAALRALGVEIESGDGGWAVWGVGVGGFREPDRVLDLGNSGTGVRLLMGLAASQPIFCCFAGDASLSRRPMARVTAPLSEMGARFLGRAAGHLPLAMSGARAPLPIVYRLPVASAQVKSAILLAALNTPGETTVIEPSPTRDHSERMLHHFGAAVRQQEAEAGARAITLTGEGELAARALHVPGDPSSAAFPLVAAACLEGAEVTVPGVTVNPTRCGLFECLREMGAEVTFAAAREEGGEPVADVTVRGGPLDGIEVPAARASSMIDEYPVLAVAAACARGRTVMAGIGELRLKESDRLAAVAEGLARSGVRVEAHHERLEIEGCGGPPPGGATIESRLDHRVAMAFLVLGLVAREAVTVDDGDMIATSFPGFVPLMNELGADIAAPS